MSAIYPFAALRPVAEGRCRGRVGSVRRRQQRGSPRAGRGQPVELSARSRPGDRPARRRAIRIRMRSTSRRRGPSPSSKRDAPLVVEETPSFYVYRLHMGSHVQAGIAACFSIDEYDRDLIKKHEKTRPDKEDDRTRHMLAIGAQTGPVFLTYRASKAVDAIVAACRAAGRRCSISPRRTACVTRCGRCRPTRTRRSSMRSRRSTPLHRRWASPAASARAARARLKDASLRHLRPLGPKHDRVLAVAFPDNQMQVLPYNRVVKDLHGLTPATFPGGARRRQLTVRKGGSPTPHAKGPDRDVPGGEWHTHRTLKTGSRRARRRRARDRRSSSRCSASTTCAPTSALISSAASAARRSSSGW